MKYHFQKNELDFMSPGNLVSVAVIWQPIPSDLMVGQRKLAHEHLACSIRFKAHFFDKFTVNFNSLSCFHFFSHMEKLQKKVRYWKSFKKHHKILLPSVCLRGKDRPSHPNVTFFQNWQFPSTIRVFSFVEKKRILQTNHFTG